MAAIFNLKDQIYSDSFLGATFTVTKEIDGSSVDLRNVNITAEFRGGFDNKVMKTCTIGYDITLNDGLGGVFSIDKFEILMPVGTYTYSIQIEFLDDNTKRTYIKGLMNILAKN